jgi:hypothetical protein
VAVHHVAHVAGQRVALAGLRGAQRDGVGPFAVRGHVRPAVAQRGGHFTGRDARQVRLLLRCGARHQERVGAQAHRAEEGRAEHVPPHLFQERVQVQRAEADAVLRLGDDQRGPAQLGGHALPHGGVVAQLGLHGLVHVGRRGLGGQEAARLRAQLVLVFGEAEFHD